MDVWGAIVVLARRFYLTVPLAVAGIFGGYTYAHSIPPEYHASAAVVLIGPTAPQNRTVPTPVNPYVTLGTNTVATTVQLDLSNAQSLAQVSAAGNSTNFTATGMARTSIITITATAKNPVRAVSTANQLISLTQSDLAARQAPYTTDKSEQITAQVLAGAQLAAPDTKSRTKAEAIVIGVAIILTILVVLIIDAILASRNRKRRAHAHAASPSLDDGITGQERTPVVRS